MTDKTIECVNRMISMLNHIDVVVEDAHMEVADRLQLTYTSVMLIKNSLQELILELDDSEDSKIGFKLEEED